jgi:pimeloyl-ACP methyl ester carboxylesterase
MEAIMPRISVDGIVLSYEERGRGDPPVLLLHAMGGSGRFMAPQLEALGRRRRTLAVDLRGHGGSDAPAGDYSTAILGDDVARLCAALELRRPVVVGHSMGGMVALELAARYPDLPGALALLDAPVVTPPGMMEAFRPLVDGLKTDAYRDVVRAFYTMVGGFADRPERLEEIIGAIAETPQHVLAACGDAVMAADTDAAAGSVAVPVLYVSAGPWYTDVDRFRSIVPDLATAQTFGSGHFHTLEVPEQVNAVLQRFLETAAAPSPSVLAGG